MAQERMTCMPMALKIVAKSAHSFAVNGKSDELKKLRNEMTILRQLAHVSRRGVTFYMMACAQPCVIQYMDSDEDSRSLYIVMEYAAHGEFFDFITDLRFNGKGIGEALSLFYAYQLVTAIEVGVCNEHAHIQI
jgi:serine/threonine protein kinase